MKKIIFILSVIFSQQAFSQNIIYKCTNSFGDVIYENTNIDKSSCVKTELGNFIKSSPSNNDKSKLKTYTNDLDNNLNIESSVIKEEQKQRDLKRILILEQEISTEKEQLNSVSSMLLNLNNSNDKDQLNKLNELKNNHINNIENIQKEIDVTKKKNNISQNEQLKENNNIILKQSKNENLNTISFNKNINLSSERIDKNMYTPNFKKENKILIPLVENHIFKNDNEFKTSNLNFINNQTSHSFENLLSPNNLNYNLFDSINSKINLELSNFELIIKHKYLMKKINELD